MAVPSGPFGPRKLSDSDVEEAKAEQLLYSWTIMRIYAIALATDAGF